MTFNDYLTNRLNTQFRWIVRNLNSIVKSSSSTSYERSQSFKLLSVKFEFILRKFENIKLNQNWCTLSTFFHRKLKGYSKNSFSFTVLTSQLQQSPFLYKRFKSTDVKLNIIGRVVSSFRISWKSVGKTVLNANT